MKRAAPEMKQLRPRSRASWRAWLARHHASSGPVWVVLAKKGAPGLAYVEAVEEALAFGWIDSRARSLDATHWIQTFSRRKPGGGWSRVNKTRIARLGKEGKLAPAGLAAIAAAKRDGSWTRWDALDRLTIPTELARALRASPAASKHFAAFPPSSKRLILAWLDAAKRPETRARRALEIVRLAAENVRANHPNGRDRPTPRRSGAPASRRPRASAASRGGGG